jgi:hypothetical protein
MENNFICQYCGENTYNVDIDYLSGANHLSCALEAEIKEKNKGTERKQILISTDIIYNTPNDIELGAKIRQIYNSNL